MRTARGFERLVNFSDAVVAIALTLLVLPLVEIPTELTQTQSLGEVFADNGALLGSFALSFLVIWSFWATHHRTMEYFHAYDSMLIRFHLIWLFTIVALPFTTQLLNSSNEVDGAVSLYIGVLLISAFALFAMSWWGRRRPELLDLDSGEVREWASEPASFVTVASLAAALMLSLLIPAVSAWPLLLLLLDSPIEKLIARLRRR
ncbi:MAG: TMEM175 family protein [Aeromicrobium sp.]